MKIYHLKIERATKAEIIIYDDGTAKKVVAKARRAIRAGHQVTWMDGTKQWNDTCVLADADMREIYNPDNVDEIKVQIVLKTISKTGEISQVVLREEWMDAEKAWRY